MRKWKKIIKKLNMENNEKLLESRKKKKKKLDKPAM